MSFRFELLTFIFFIIKKLLIFFLPVLFSCSDSNGDLPTSSACESFLPAITTTGANTFGCCVDGKLLKPRDGTGSTIGNDDSFSYYGGYPNITDYYELDIRDFKSDRTAKLLLHLHEVHANGIGQYIINKSNGNSSLDGLNHTYLHCKIYSDKKGDYQYYRSFENSGTVQITNYNFNEGLLSGTFNATVVNSADSTDIIEIKGGRFDLNGYTLPQTNFP